MAEVRRLERELLVWGPMPSEHLANRVGAGHWHEGTFQEALQEGERCGILRRLAFGWVAATAKLQPPGAEVSPDGATPHGGQPRRPRTRGH